MGHYFVDTQYNLIYFQSIENPRADNAIEQFFGIECSSELKCVEVRSESEVSAYFLN